MIGRFLDFVFSEENIKRVASFVFLVNIILFTVLGYVVGDEISRHYKTIGTIIGFVIGFGLGLTEAFAWHVLGQILDYLKKIMYATKSTMIAVVKSYSDPNSTSYKTECQNVVSVAKYQTF